MIEFSVVAYGDCAALIDVAEPAEVIGIRDGLLARGDPAVRSVVPAARTVLVEFDPIVHDLASISALVDGATSAPADRPAGESVTVPVHYDGDDLESVAAATGLSVESVIGRHLDAEYTVQFCGFSPGFGYLTGLDEQLRLPRLDSPRPAVPAGSVAIADEYTGIYPRRSPGGWRLLGHTEAVLFDVERTPPALLAPGTRVRFVRR